MDLFPKCRTYNAWTHAETGERVYHVKDYPDIGDGFDLTPRGSGPSKKRFKRSLTNAKR